jgi:hypothetical protein
VRFGHWDKIKDKVLYSWFLWLNPTFWVGFFISKTYDSPPMLKSHQD